MKIRFELKSKKENESLIFIIVSIAGKALKKSTGQRILTKYWNNGYPVSRAETKGIRMVLAEIKARLEKLDQECFISNRPLTIEFVNNRITDIITGKIDSANPVTELFKKFNQAMLTEVKHGTVQTYTTLANHIKDYEAKFKSELYLDDINIGFGKKFTQFLLSEYIDINTGKVRSPIQNPTINKQIRNLKTFCAWCFENGYTKNKEWEKISFVKEVEQTVTALFPEELEIIAKTIYPTASLERVKDVFLFSCYTGLRYKDLLQIEKDRIVNNHIHIQLTNKTSVTVRIPLHAKAMDILIRHDYKLPMISNQKLNKYIKQVCTIAGITRKVEIVEQKGLDITTKFVPINTIASIHDGRRSFITSCLMKGLHTNLVMELSTHKSLQAFKRYINFADSFKETELAKVF